MMPSEEKPVLRPQVDALLEVGRLVRRALRSIIPDPDPPSADARRAAIQTIDDAISHLVSARRDIEKGLTP